MVTAAKVLRDGGDNMSHWQDKSAYDELLTCDNCGKSVAFGRGDLNCTQIICTACYTLLPERDEPKDLWP